MNPLDVLIWAGVIAGVVLIACVAAMLVAGVVKQITGGDQ